MSPFCLMDRFRLQNPVPVLDAGGHGREPSLSLLFCHMNQDILLKRSSDLTGSDLAAAPATNLSAEGVRPPTASSLPWSVYTGPGGAIQLQHGPHAGRLLVPALSIFNTSDACYMPVGCTTPACQAAKLCWSTNSKDYALISDDGGQQWRAGAHAGSIAGCGPGSVQCGDEFELAERADGVIVGVSRHPGGPAFVQSSTQGESWGAWTVLKTPQTGGCQTSLLAVPGSAGWRPLLMAAPWSSTWAAMTVSMQSSDGSWRRLQRFGSGSAGYSSMAALPGSSTVLLLWESADPTSNASGAGVLALDRLSLKSDDASASPKPHLVIALADDLVSGSGLFEAHALARALALCRQGWNDLQGFGHGNRMQSPHIAALAAEGIRLSEWYVFKFCSPSRSQTLSGRYAFHLGQQTQLNLNPRAIPNPEQDSSTSSHDTSFL